MEPIIKRPKGLLISAWIVSVLAFIVLAPFAFIAGIFSSDNSSGASSTMSYVFLASPLLLLVFPIISQVMYRRMKYVPAKWLAVAAISLPIAAVAYLASILLGA